MRFILKVRMSVEAGNAAVRSGKIGQTIQAILEDSKAEAAYFTAENGQRTGYVVVNVQEPSELPKFAEPWFLAFNAAVEFHAAMTAADLEKAGPAIEAAARKY